MADKRVCGICTEHGHSSSQCPRRNPDFPTPEAVAWAERERAPLLIQCPNCELLEAEVAMLKRRLAERVTETPPIKVTGVTETPSIVVTVTKNHRGRPSSGNALTPAQKQRAYRERHGNASAS